MKPAALHPGDLIGILSPAGSLSPGKLEMLQDGVRYIERCGYRVKTGKFIRSQYGYLAGTDKQRAADLNRMLLDPEVKAVFCSRGGYGSTRLLNQLEWNRIAAFPKIIMGYSDITALQLAFYQRLGWITFSGPLVAVELSRPAPLTGQSLWAVLTGDDPGILESGEAPADWPDFYGSAEGPLLGGCLSVISAMIGTAYCPDFDGAVLLLEDVGENLYKIDRYLSQLRNAGILDRLAGVVLGEFVDLMPDDHDPPLTLADLMQHYLSSLSIPVITGFPYGHIHEKYTLPLGCRVRIDADMNTVQFLEKGVT
ncbi:MAG: LD-carboxypeptidase [candidate division KSB1 bacterium]|nr:LD-carboxypeptidase [candidate division KSB1 bacterium]